MAPRGRGARADRQRPGRAAGGAGRRGLTARAARGSGGPPGSGGLGVDVVFPLLHGPYGEDGTIQGLLELADLPYVGSGVLGSAVGMDKVMMKRAFAACGLPQADYLALRDGEDRAVFADRVEAELGLPCFVKPANMGSSVGVSKAQTGAELDAAIDRALEFDEWILAEEAVEGREIEVAVLGDDPPEASLPGEIVPGAEFYTYADKYEDGAADLLIPAPLDDARTAEVRALAVRAFEACRCEAMARVDFFFEEAGPRVPRERAQHDSGLHADLDVPEALGGLGAAVPRAARPAHRRWRSNATPAGPDAPAAPATRGGPPGR